MSRFALLLALGAAQLLGAWDPTVRLTYSDSASHNAMTPARSIAAGPSGSVRVVFYVSGRRALSPKPGVYFTTEDGARSTVHVRKVVLTR